MKAIERRLIGPTNTKPARIVAEDSDGNRVVMSTNHPIFQHGDERLHKQVAEALAEKMQWSGQLVGGGTKRGYCFVFVS